MLGTRVGIAVGSWLAFAGDADASPHDAVAAPALDARAVVARGGLAPLVAHAGDAGRARILISTSWNGAADRTELEVGGELAVWGRLRLVARVDDATGTESRPGIGAGVQVLDQVRHGVDASGYLIYRAEGFTEPEGEIEATLAAGRRFGPAHATVALTYGQDPEGRERDGEIAMLARVAVRRDVFVGITGRYRDALGSPGDAGIVRDLTGGATTTVAFDRFAVTATAGVAALATPTTALHAGPTATLSVGAAF